MALFGGELVEVTTPDGRRVSMPADLARNFEGLQPVQPEAPPPIPATPAIGNSPAFAPPGGAPQLPPALDVPAFTPQDTQQIQQLGAPPPIGGEQPAAPSPPPIAPAAPPQIELRDPTQISLTTKDLQKTTNADVFNAESAARTARGAAVKDLATVEADEATRIAAERVAVDAKTDEILAERDKKAKEFQSSLDARMKKYETDALDIKNTKIDRDADHPILAMAMVLLGGVGAALSGDKTNLAFDAFIKGLDRKVQGQMQDIEVKRGNLAMDRDQIGMAREMNRDALAEFDTRRIAELGRVKEKIETIKAQSMSQRVVANANIALASIDEETAKTYGAAATREADKMRADQARKDALNAQAQARKDQAKRDEEAKAERDRNFNEGVRQFNVTQDNAQAAKQGAGAKVMSEAEQKLLDKNEERAIRVNGVVLLQPEGEKMVEGAKALEDDAKKFEAKAAEVANPERKSELLAQAGMRQQKAQEIRKTAELQHAVRAGTAGEREKLSKQLADTQSALSIIDEMKNLRSVHGSEWFGTAEGQALVAKGKLLELTVKDAFELGAIDNGSIQYLKSISGGDPSGLYLGQVIEGLGSKGPEGALDTLAQALESKGRNRLGAYAGNANKFRFKRDALTAQNSSETAAIDALRDKTPLESAEGEKRSGALGKASDFITDAFSLGLDTPIEQQRQDAAAATGDEYGLSEAQASAADLQIRTYAAGKAAKTDKAREAAQRSGDILVGIASSSDRPALRNAVLSKLQTEAPDLYQQALARMPAEQRAEIQQLTASNAAAAASVLPIATIRDKALAGDDGARSELARRAASGDRDAVRAVQDVIAAKRGIR